MTEFSFKKNENALVIVAHPDDETIWMGGTILKYSKMNWTIFSLCRSSDPDRAPKFFKVCKNYGAKGIMTDLEDEDRMSIADSVPVIERLIRKEIKDKKFNYIFTHGTNGEYGHPRHKGVNLTVNKMAKNSELNADQIFYFNYVKTSRKLFSSLTSAKNSDMIISLSPAQFNRKKKVMTDIYGFDPKGIDANLCTNPEAFKKLTINKFNTN